MSFSLLLSTPVSASFLAAEATRVDADDNRRATMSVAGNCVAPTFINERKSHVRRPDYVQRGPDEDAIRMWIAA